MTRYADDFAVCCHSRQQAESVREKLAGWLAERGLSLNEDKTRIVRLSEGFDFLGWNFRRYPGGKLLIKPSKAAVRKHRQRLADETRRLRGSNAAAVIAALNPVIRGWTAYHRGQVSKETFNSLGRYTWQLTYKWARWTHPRKGSPLDNRQVLREVLPGQGRQVGLRRPGNRRATCSSTNGRASGGTSWSGTGHPLMTRTWPDTGETGGAGTAPRSTQAPSPCSAGSATAARHAETMLIDAHRLPASPEEWEDWWHSVTRQQVPRAAIATGTAPPPEGNRTILALIHASCRTASSGAQEPQH